MRYTKTFVVFLCTKTTGYHGTNQVENDLGGRKYHRLVPNIPVNVYFRAFERQTTSRPENVIEIHVVLVVSLGA